jgi:putative transposase
MPDHYHLVVKVLVKKAVSKYMSDVENSFSRFFNIKSKRKGPLWQSVFKFVRINTNEQLIHVTRYVHLNATTSLLVDNPEDWTFSSYKYFVKDKKYLEYASEISIQSPDHYKKFVEDRKDYQKKLKFIKKHLSD